MLRLRSSIHHSRADEFGSLLRDLDGVRRMVQQADENAAEQAYVFAAEVPTPAEAHYVVAADVEPVAADCLFDAVDEFGIDSDDFVLPRIEVVAPQHRHH